MGQQIKKRKQHALSVLLKWLIITPAPACTKWDPAWGNVLNMHIKANEKVNLEIQIGYIYMLKMSHSYHFSGSGSEEVCSLFCGWGEWGRRNSLQKRLNVRESLCRGRLGKEYIPYTDGAKVPKRVKKKHSKVSSHLRQQIQICGKHHHFPLGLLVEQIIASFANK